MGAAAAFEAAGVLYGLGFLAVLAGGGRWRWAVDGILGAALLCNGWAVGLRYWQAWPMMPMFLAPVALPLGLGALALLRPGLGAPEPSAVRVRCVVMGMIAFLALAAVCFPKDFYLPFWRSQSLWAHLFLAGGVAGRACWLFSAALAAVALWRGMADGSGVPTPHVLARAMRWTVWGFAFSTVAMFAGGVWSYRGWGTPVVWDDAIILGAMAVWFYYIGLLHLHLTGRWRPRGRALYAAAGAVMVIALTVLPDLGPFRRPF